MQYTRVKLNPKFPVKQGTNLPRKGIPGLKYKNKLSHRIHQNWNSLSTKILP